MDPVTNPPADPARIPATPPEPQPQQTEDEKFAERLKAERAKWESDAAAKSRREQEAAEKKKAEEEGKFKELADKAEAKAEAAEARALAAERSALIDDAFVETSTSQPGLSLKSLREWVKPKVLAGLTPDTTSEDVTALAKKLAEQFVKDNPVQAKGSAGAPPAPRGGMKTSGADMKPNTNRPRFSTLNANI